MPTVALFDGTGLLVRCDRAGVAGLHAGPVPTGPLLLFANRMASMIRDCWPTHVAVAWDGERGRDRRTGIYSGYKAGRQPFRGGQHYELAREFCYAAGIFQYVDPESEADDLIAAFCRTARREIPDADIWIHSDDADLHQLIDDRTIQRAEGGVWDLERVHSHYGCEPREIPVLRSFSGDPSDNIPGIRGFGLKKARALLEANNWDMAEAMSAAGLDNQARSDALAYLAVMGLSPAFASYPEDSFPLPFEESLRWDPEGSAARLEAFLEKYEMVAMLRRLREGRLWGRSA